MKDGHGGARSALQSWVARCGTNASFQALTSVWDGEGRRMDVPPARGPV